MGTQKLLLPVRGTRMIDRVIAACAPFPTVLVASPGIAGAIGAAHVSVIVNTEPRLGMAHSLALADRAVEADRAIAVLLGDKPLVTKGLVAAVICAAQHRGADVCFPARGGVGGHPVYFSPRARASIGLLTGDSLQSIRDDPELRRVMVPMEDEGAYFDVDDPGALQRVPE